MLNCGGGSGSLFVGGTAGCVQMFAHEGQYISRIGYGVDHDGFVVLCARNDPESFGSLRSRIKSFGESDRDVGVAFAVNHQERLIAFSRHGF